MADDDAGVLTVLGQSDELVFVVRGETLEPTAVRHDVVFGQGGQGAQAEGAAAQETHRVLVD